MLRSPINGNSNDILKQLRQAEYGAHYIIVYYDMMTLRQIYTGYIKSQLEYNNELVLILPYYETTETVRSVLSENHISNGGNIIDVRKYEKEGSLIIRSEEHTSELQSRQYLVCRLLLEKKK